MANKQQRLILTCTLIVFALSSSAVASKDWAFQEKDWLKPTNKTPYRVPRQALDELLQLANGIEPAETLIHDVTELLHLEDASALADFMEICPKASESKESSHNHVSKNAVGTQRGRSICLLGGRSPAESFLTIIHELVHLRGYLRYEKEAKNDPFGYLEEDILNHIQSPDPVESYLQRKIKMLGGETEAFFVQGQTERLLIKQLSTPLQKKTVLSPVATFFDSEGTFESSQMNEFVNLILRSKGKKQSSGYWRLTEPVNHSSPADRSGYGYRQRLLKRFLGTPESGEPNQLTTQFRRSVSLTNYFKQRLSYSDDSKLSENYETSRKRQCLILAHFFPLLSENDRNTAEGCSAELEKVKRERGRAYYDLLKEKLLHSEVGHGHLGNQTTEGKVKGTLQPKSLGTIAQ